MRKLIQITVTPARMILQMIYNFIVQNGFKIATLVLGLCFVLDSNFNLSLNFNNNKDIIPNSAEQFSFGETLGNFLDFNTSHTSTIAVEKSEKVSIPQTDMGNTYSNMTYGKSTSNGSKKQQRQLKYVDRFKDVARSEMKKYGIPASITLAQGLIESNAGESRLSRENNNHFGMKCFSKSCKKGHCANFTDDSHKDFFRKYASSWESYRAHSKLLQGKRYRGLRNHGNDYKKWAHGLKKAGYATDRRYAEKLIHIIEELNLAQYDK